MIKVNSPCRIILSVMLLAGIFVAQPATLLAQAPATSYSPVVMQKSFDTCNY